MVKGKSIIEISLRIQVEELETFQENKTGVIGYLLTPKKGYWYNDNPNLEILGHNMWVKVLVTDPRTGMEIKLDREIVLNHLNNSIK